MDFGLSQDQILLKDTIRRFLDAECPTTRVRQVMESDSGHDAALRQGLADLGAVGLHVPAAHGGAGLELLDLALAAEELAYHATPGPFLPSALAAIAIAEGASDAQKERWLPRLADGSVIGTYALGEADGTWSPEAVQTRFESGSLTGKKTLVPYGALADLLVIAGRDAAGPGLFLVERASGGLSAKPLSGVDMTRRVADLELTGARAEKLAGGLETAKRARDAALVLLAADAYGGSRRMVDMAAAYAKQREQFGQIIGAFQAVKHQLASLACDLEPSLSLWWYAAHAFDRIRDQSERHAAIAKSHLTDLFDRVARDTTELHGGIGFTWEYDLHLWFRRAIYDRSLFGDAAFHRARAADLAGW